MEGGALQCKKVYKREGKCDVVSEGKIKRSVNDLELTDARKIMGAMTMWNLDDTTKYQKIFSFTIPKAFTYADMREGKKDVDKREYIRALAAPLLPSPKPQSAVWAFRIFVEKSGKRLFDIENVPKTIIDSFCERQITWDQSKFTQLALYPDDNLDFIRVIQIAGQRNNSDSIKVEIFGCVEGELK